MSVRRGVEEGIAFPQTRGRTVRRDDFRLDLDDIDLAHARRHSLDDYPAAVSHHQHALDVGTRDDG